MHQRSENKDRSDKTDRTYIIVLSAKNEDRLREYTARLCEYLEKSKICNLKPKISDIAYTLQVGRRAMEERLAFIAGSVEDLEKKLQDFIASQDNQGGFYRGQVRRNKEGTAIFAADEDMAKTLDAWIRKRKLSKLVDLWVKGLTFDWNRLYEESKPRRISLPTYPFASNRYFFEGSKNRENTTTINAAIPSRNGGMGNSSQEFHSSILDRLISNEIGIDEAIQKVKSTENSI